MRIVELVGVLMWNVVRCAAASRAEDIASVPGYTLYRNTRCTGSDDICGPGDAGCNTAYTPDECALLCERYAHCVSFAFRSCGAGARLEAGVPSMNCALSTNCTNLQADAVCLPSRLPRAPGGEPVCVFPDGTPNRGSDCWDLYIRDGQYGLGEEHEKGGCTPGFTPVVAQLECNAAAAVLRLPVACSEPAAVVEGCWTREDGLWWSPGGDGSLAGAFAVCRRLVPLPTVEAGSVTTGSHVVSPISLARGTEEWGRRCCDMCEHNMSWCAPQLVKDMSCGEAHPPVSGLARPP
eukprot:Hpha_TRINITY_DN35028_c0_g1::TRINITY_DN35028_c0_g1_i1::g.82715::m.82715